MAKNDENKDETQNEDVQNEVKTANSEPYGEEETAVEGVEQPRAAAAYPDYDEGTDEDGNPLPKLVQVAHARYTPAQAATDAALTPSARSVFWAQAPDELPATTRATHAAQRAAWAQYVARPDIEGRESILARENAYPGDFSDKNPPGNEVPTVVDATRARRAADPA